MNRIVLVSVVIASISALVGCGAHTSKQTTSAPTTSYSAVDCPPPPGGDMQFDFAGAPEKVSVRGNHAGSIRPNAPEKPKSGAVHAAY
jgi:hypothetical protein